MRKLPIIFALSLTFSSVSAMAAMTCPTFDKALRLKQLTELQYDVTQKAATEKPFENAYWDNEEDGIYVGIVSGEPLYSSRDKYKSGTGWPSFTKPIAEDAVITRSDRSYFFIVRTEVLSRCGNSHLGHVFNDGPAPTGMRYCMNSAALSFIPVDQMKERGYGDYLYLFD